MSLSKLEHGDGFAAFTVAQPAAGADWSFTVPTGLCYKFETLFFTLTTSAVVANRVLRLQITDGTNIVWEGGSISSYVASGVYRFGIARMSPQATAAANGQIQLIYLPEIWIPAGYVLQTSTVAKDVADQYSAVRGIVRVSSADWS